ncbi:MAG: CHAP domain-containing protein [Ruminococcus sp.]|uniref:dockerin type I domain-containing protein n=1 Tax=Ruminococcus sp. TaxID=41978 RepID=UPI002873267A|nr:dockerin type I domain-containing protein [Ruminococcus sp.]MBQ3284774.1 CHAP domain-containing protein [Ruminococcus sp.]
MKVKRIISVLTVIAVLMTSVFSVSASGEDLRFSEEYKTSPYYTKLMQALEETKDGTTMEKTLAVALSQEGYANFATEGYDLDQARAEGKLWTGAELRMNDNLTGNTEYTRWAQQYVMDCGEGEQYADYDWCAIFTSWCLYQAGYYDEEIFKRYFYCYVVDPRIFWSADEWIETFSLDQKKVYYAPNAHHKLDAMPWNTYYNVDVDPIDEMPYKPGGLVFFGWNGTGDYFSHVAIVIDYDKDTHVLTYTNGNSDGMVITRQIDLDVEESFRGQAYTLNANRIMAYADYDKYVAPEQKEISVETPVIKWDKSASSGLKIKTDSEGIMASVNMDGEYHGSILESNMVFHEGLLTIGKSELVGLSVGLHKMKLVFDDGEVETALKITDRENTPQYLVGDVDMDGTVSIIDVTLIQRYLAGAKELTPEQLMYADVDDSGEVEIVDATVLQRYLAWMNVEING